MIIFYSWPSSLDCEGRARFKHRAPVPRRARLIEIDRISEGNRETFEVKVDGKRHRRLGLKICTTSGAELYS